MRPAVLVALALLSATPALTSASQCCWSGVQRVVAVGDVHGDLYQFRKVLLSAGIIDSYDQWTGGKTHLVQTGDILDRGPDSRKVLDLLWTLGKQAEQAGGFVHALIGNHEAMVSGGDFRYVHKGEILSHGGIDSMAAAMAPGGTYGERIMSMNTIIRIDDLLFLHGGLSSRYTGIPLVELNNAIRNVLTSGKTSTGILGSDGPLWFRGYAEESETALYKRVRDLYCEYGTFNVVGGHTVSIKGILFRCDGRVVQIDTGLSGHYGGKPRYLLIEGGRMGICGL